MKFYRFCRSVMMVCVIMALPLHAAGAPANEGNVGSPAKKWRIVYVEGGDYTDYQQILAATARGLAKLGLIANGNVPIPENSASTSPMWDWLHANAGGDRIEFLQNGHYTANWNDQRRAANKAALLQRIHEVGDVDMIFAYGTAAGLDMATNEHSVPTMSMSVTDAVEAGIVTSADDSGFDHVHAQLELGRYKRQIAVFHDAFKFKRLGIPYEDTPEGRSTVALAAIEEAATELGIELVRCTAPLYTEQDESYNNLLQCLTTLANTSDAVYLTTNSGMQWHRMTALLQPLIDAGKPSFSQSGLEETRLGVLMSLAQDSFDNEGLFGAESVAKVIAGARPRDLTQLFEGPLGLAINLKMAMLIGWNPPFEILAAVDDIYQDLRNADK